MRIIPWMVTWLLWSVLLAGCGGGQDAAPPGVSPLPAALQLTVPAMAEVAEQREYATDVPADASGLSFRWDFGDGEQSRTARPQHAYRAAGVFTVRVTVEDTAGRQVSAERVVQVVPDLRLHGLRCSGPGSAGWCRQLAQPWKPGLRDLKAVDESVAWAVGEDGVVMRSPDAGRSWVDVSVAGGPRLAAVAPIDRQRAWVVGWTGHGTGRIWQTQDGGVRWTQAAAEVPLAYPSRLHAITGEVLIAWGLRPGSAPAITEDGGRSWRLLPRDVHHVERDGTLWGLPVTPEGQSFNPHPGIAFQKSIDRGRTFLPEAGWPADGVVDWMGVSDGGWAWALSSRWVGESWNLERSFTLLTRRGTQAPWTPAPLPGQDRMAGLIVTPSGSLAVTIGRLATSLALWHSPDGGNRWTARTWPVERVGQWQLIDGQSLYATFQRNERPPVSTDGGQSWAQDRPGLALAGGHLLQAVDSSPMGLLLRSSADFGPHQRSSWQISSNGGRSWTMLWDAADGNPARWISELWFKDTRRGIAITAEGAVIDTGDGGRTWRTRDASASASGSLPRAALQAGRHGGLWALSGPRVLRSDDDGQTWNETPTQPDLPSDSRGSTTRLHALDRDLLIVSQTTFHVVSPHWPGWFITTLHRSEDAGRTWRTLPANDCEDIAFGSATQGICLRRDQSRYTTDGGLTWQPASGAAVGVGGALRSLRSTDGAGQAVWWALGPATLARSLDEGRSWQAMALPPMPQRLDTSGAQVAAQLRDIAFSGSRGWIVGEEGVVLFTEDGGSRWVVQPTAVHSTLQRVFALNGQHLWIGAEQTVLSSATGGQ